MNLQQAISVLTVHQEWRMGAEIPLLDPRKLTEAIRIILYDHLHKQLETKQLETKPGFVEKREKQAWDIIEEMVGTYEEDNDEALDYYDVMQYLKTICHPPMLKQQLC